MEYGCRLSDCSQDEMTDRKREALISFAWLPRYLRRECLFVRPMRRQYSCKYPGN